MDLRTGSVPFSRGILYTSPSFQLNGVRVGNLPGKTPQYLLNTIHNDALFFLSILSKCGILLLEGPYLHIIHLKEIIWGFLRFLIIYHT